MQKHKYSCRMCNNRKIDLMATVDGFDFFRCKRCLFVFCPTIDQLYLNKLYASGYHNSEEGAPDTGWADTEFLKPALEFLNRKQMDILDFGCGESKVPDILRNQGYSVTGIDVAPPVREQENRLTGNILDLELPRNKFDLVYSFQVFEHLPEPEPVLNELLSLTKPEGVLLIHTDMEVPERFKNGFDGWWYVTPPDHCSFYRHRTFEVYVNNLPHRLVYKDEKTVIIEKRH